MLTPSCLERVFTGHDGRVTDITYSNSNGMILSTSSDGTAKVWTDKADSPAINISHYLHEPSFFNATSPSIKVGGRNKPIASEIISGQFYHLDRLIALVMLESL